MIEKRCATRLRYNKQTSILQYLLLLRFHKINNIFNEQNQYITTDQRREGKVYGYNLFYLTFEWKICEKFLTNYWVSTLTFYFSTLTYLEATATATDRLERNKIAYKKYSQLYIRLNQTLLSMVECKRVRTNWKLWCYFKILKHFQN